MHKRWHWNILGKTPQTSFLHIHFHFSASTHFPVANNLSLVSAWPVASSSSLYITVTATILPSTGDYHLCLTFSLGWRCLTHVSWPTLWLDDPMLQPPFLSLSYRPPRQLFPRAQRSQGPCWHQLRPAKQHMLILVCLTPPQQSRGKGSTLASRSVLAQMILPKTPLKNRSASQLHHEEGPKPQRLVRWPDVITGFLYSHKHWFALCRSYQHWIYYLLVK